MSFSALVEADSPVQSYENTYGLQGVSYSSYRTSKWQVDHQISQVWWQGLVFPGCIAAFVSARPDRLR